MEEYTILIDGMGCMNCVRRVTEAFTAAGAEVVSCEIGKAVVRTALGKDAFGATAASLLDELGFDAREVARR